MKNRIIFVLLILVFFSCTNTSTKKIKDSIYASLSEDIKLDSICLLKKDCKIKFKKAFIKAKVWPQNARLIKSARFYPDKSLITNFTLLKENIFLAFLYERKNGEVWQDCYLYNTSDKNFNTLIPLHLQNGKIIKDTNFMVLLYFQKSLDCGCFTTNKSKYSSPQKNGIFKKQHSSSSTPKNSPTPQPTQNQPIKK